MMPLKLHNHNDIVEYIKYYKNEKVTKLALEQELTLSILSSAFAHLDLSVKIIRPNANALFGMIMTPEFHKHTNTIGINIYLDETVVRNSNPETTIQMISSVMDHYPKIIEIGNSFRKLYDKDFTLENALTLMLDCALWSVPSAFGTHTHAADNGETESQQIVSQMIHSGDIEGEIREITQKDEPIETVIERISVSGLLPKDIIEDAKRLTETFSEGPAKIVDLSDRSQFGINGSDKPAINPVYDTLREITDNTYDMYDVKTIPHNYKPDSNQ